MADLALDADGDIDISGAAMSIVRGGDAIVQNSLIRFRLFQGEWFLDTSVGMPYFQQILVKNPQLPVVANFFRQAAATQPGIVSVDSLTLTLDARTRQARVAYQATGDAGATLTFDKSFVIPT